MRGPSRAIGRVVMVLVLAAGVAGAHNVLGDNSAVLARAEAEACAGAKPPCRASLARLLRSAFGQEIDYRVARQTVRIRCTRSLFLVGEYSCARQP